MMSTLGMMVSDLRYAEQLLWEWDCNFETDESFISWVLFINVKTEFEESNKTFESVKYVSTETSVIFS